MVYNYIHSYILKMIEKPQKSILFIFRFLYKIYL